MRKASPNPDDTSAPSGDRGQTGTNRAELERFRKDIDQIDGEILDLLNRRAVTVRKVGDLKRGSSFSFYDPKREKQLLDRLTRTNKGPFPGEALRLIFKEIISASRSLESPMAIAYLGPEGTFTHEAARKQFGKSSQYIPMPRCEDVFSEVQKGNCQYGVLPIENSTEGVERRTVDLFLDSPLRISSEICIQVRHNLVSRGTLETIKRVYSHPQALSQCRTWLGENLPGAEFLPVSSTAQGIREASRDPENAGIGSEIGAGLYNVPILVHSIQDSSWNQTRFVVIGNEQPEPSGNDKTSVILFLKDEPGSLYRALGAFRRSGINLSNIESRPTKKEAWKYMFYIDFEGHARDERTQKVFHALERRSLYFKVIGSYPVDSSAERTP